MQKQEEQLKQKLKKLEYEHEKAIKAIQVFIEREQEMRDADSHKEHRILELETELRKRRNGRALVSLKDLDVNKADDPAVDSNNQVHIAIIFFYLIC